MEVNIVSQGRHTSIINSNEGEHLKVAMLESFIIGENTLGKENKEYPTKDRNYTLDDIKKATDKLNKLLEDKSTHVEYEVYGKSKSITIKILNNKTKEIVKEIPPKKIIDMVDKLCELAGVFVDQRA